MARYATHYEGFREIYVLILNEADAVAAAELGFGKYHAGQEIQFKPPKAKEAREDAHRDINKRAEEIRANRKKKPPQS